MDLPDSIDERLVRILGRDAQQNSEVLAKKLNVSAATVRRRLRRLINSKSLRIIGVIDPAKFGFPLAAVIALNIAPDKLKSAMEILRELPEILWASTTTGRFDVIARAQFHTTEHLSEFMTAGLTKLEGLKDSETFICLDIAQGSYMPFR